MAALPGIVSLGWHFAGPRDLSWLYALGAWLTALAVGVAARASESRPLRIGGAISLACAALMLMIALHEVWQLAGEVGRGNHC